MKAYKKKTDRAEEGYTFWVSAFSGTTGGIYTNAKDLRQYIKRKSKEGFKLASVKRPQVANVRFYEVWIYKGSNPWKGVEE